MSIRAEHQLLSSKKSFKDIDIPPRKLLTRHAVPETAADMCSDSPRFSSSDETLLQNLLPYNKLLHSDDDDADPYSSDHFRMYEFKVRRCTRSRSHDWTDCPFAHPGEKARRRDPRRYHYSGNVCPEYRRGGCSRGDNCEFAHGVFECWLHPARYRTEACKDGKNCKRKVCFFAHTPRQLRILPVNSNSQNYSADISCKKNKFLNPASVSNNCCLFCHCAATSSPNSTLLSLSHFSPPLSPSSSGSPPLSPVKQGRIASAFSPIPRYSERFGGISETSSGPNHVVTELMSSLESLNLVENSPLSAERTNYLPWPDVSFNAEDQQQQFVLSPSNSLSYEDEQQFILSPVAQSTTTSTKHLSNEMNKMNKVSDNGSSSCQAPDLGWVNELLM